MKGNDASQTSSGIPDLAKVQGDLMESAQPGTPKNQRWLVLGICLLLAGLVWLVFGQTLRHDFVNCDDGVYVFENEKVLSGLNWANVRWAFTHFDCNFYHPLTMISLMLDFQIHGFDPRGFHLTNVLLHTASAIVLFLVLRGMTNHLWRSAFVAAIFAIHPLRVESVAWVAERKDVLSAFFFMLTLRAYLQYCRSRREEASGNCAAKGTKFEPPLHLTPDTPHLTPLATYFSPLAWYILTLVPFAFGLMSKPMLVTLPFVLLLLDYWPLRRALAGDDVRSSASTPGVKDSLRRLLQLVAEKIPFFVLSIAACVIAVMAQGKAVVAVSDTPLLLRAGNAAVSCVTYIIQMFWPANLAAYYPFPVHGIPAWQIALSLILLATVSIGCLIGWRKQRELLVGWLWYLGMLVPMIGIIQVGMFARADRYTYIPQIGLYVLLTWGVAGLFARWRHHRLMLGSLGSIALLALVACARVQASYWQNSETLWTHTLACTGDNAVAGNNLGHVLFDKGEVNEAIARFERAVQIKPDYVEARYNLGTALLRRGQAYDAVVQFQYVAQLKPDDADIRNNLGNALSEQGKSADAIVQYEKALELQPNLPETQNNLAWVLATSPQMSLRNGSKAVALAEQANQSTSGESPLVLHTLAAAYAETGQFSNAVQNVTRAIQLAQNAGRPDLAAQFNIELKLYETAQPFRQKSQ